VIRHAGTAVIALLALVLISGGCASKPAVITGDEPDINTGTLNARLIVSCDFGKTLMLDKLIEVEDGTTALEALAQYADVDTAYGGGFVKAVEGISSGYMSQPVTREDWFLYINGILTNTGGLAYGIKDGDTIHWYYRDWSFRQSVSSIIGDFPEPFLHGFNGLTVPTLVLYQDGFEVPAGSLFSRLNSISVPHVNIKIFNSATTDEIQNSNLILIGDRDFEPIAEINSLWNRLGLFSRFNNDLLETYGFDGKPAGTFSSGAGIIIAMQNPFNPRGTGVCENVCWVISGTDHEGITAAVNLMTNNPDSLKYLAGAVVLDGTVLPLPR